MQLIEARYQLQLSEKEVAELKMHQQELELQNGDGNLHRHSRNETSHFGFIDIATEDEVVHVGHTGDGSTIVESVGMNESSIKAIIEPVQRYNFFAVLVLFDVPKAYSE